MIFMKNRRSIMTKKMIEDSFYELLEKNPVEKISVKSLCDNADINRSTFYLHYQTIEDLVDEIEQTLINKQIELLGKVNKRTDTRPFIIQTLSMLEKRPKVYLHLLENGHFVQLYTEKMEHYFENFVELSHNIKTTYTFEYIVSGSFAISKKWLESGCKLSKKNLAELIFSLNYGAAYGNSNK